MPTTFPTRTHLAAAIIGRVPVDKLGPEIHVVEHPAFGCPVPGCDTAGPMTVYVTAVRWMCGHTRSLPKHNPACYAGCYHNLTAALAARRDYHRRTSAEARAIRSRRAHPAA
jgi:hypothetical protein